MCDATEDIAKLMKIKVDPQAEQAGIGKNAACLLVIARRRAGRPGTALLREQRVWCGARGHKRCTSGVLAVGLGARDARA